MMTTTLCCYHLASKYEEIYPISFRRLSKAYLDINVNMNDLHLLEVQIFKTIDFQFDVITLNKFIQILGDVKLLEITENLIKYINRIALLTLNY